MRVRLLWSFVATLGVSACAGPVTCEAVMQRAGLPPTLGRAACASPVTAPSTSPPVPASAASTVQSATMPGDADPETREALRVLGEALTIVYNQHVDARPIRDLVVHALRGIERRLSSRGVAVRVAENAITVSHGEPGQPEHTLNLSPSDPPTPHDGLATIASAMTFLRGRTGLRTDELKDALIHGLMATDPYGDYLDRQTYREMQAEAAGQFSAIGVELYIREEVLTVVAPIEGTPAYRAGLETGDRITKIDGVSMRGVGLADAVGRLRGRTGTRVTLTVERDGWSEPRDMSIIREQVRVTNVSSRDLGNAIAYVRLRQFQDQTPRDLAAILDPLVRTGVRGLVIDLRDNPGGLLTAGVEVAEMFLKKGHLITYTTGRVRNQNMRFSAQAKLPITSVPMVTLINTGSAGASEFVAAALQEWGRSINVGTNTFGRGSVQAIIPLPDGSGLRLSTARFFSPTGRLLDAKGVRPDVEVVVPRNAALRPGDLSADPQLRRALEWLREEARRAVPQVITTADGAEMVLIPKGEAWMGNDFTGYAFLASSPDESPRHQVYLDAFYMDRHEVTNVRFGEFVRKGYERRDLWSSDGWQSRDTERPSQPRLYSDARWNAPDKPVIGVSWYEADAYCRFAGKRLPTEAEWERAARGIDARDYPWANRWDPDLANGEERLKRTVSVGSYGAGTSPYEVHDMAGNAAEWVADWFGPYRADATRNPRGPASGAEKVFRGGSWAGQAVSLRAAYRGYGKPDERYVTVGFRCAKDATQ